MLDKADIAPVTKLSRDLRAAAATLNEAGARYLVDTYYIMQRHRIRLDGQIRAMTTSGEPHEIVRHFAEQTTVLEKQIAGALSRYTDSHPVGQWMRSQKGIGPVLSAGLLAHIDITRAPTAGALWRFAGLDPTVIWNSSEYVRGHVAATRKALKSDWLTLLALCKDFNRKPLEVLRSSGQIQATPEVADAVRVCQELLGIKIKPKAQIYPDNILAEMLPKERLEEGYKELVGEMDFAWKEIIRVLNIRPWNARLKVLCWKVGESFVKTSGEDAGYYGGVYRDRKEQEVRFNEEGRLAKQAALQLERKRYVSDTIAKKAYEAGRLPDGHLHRRATRYAAKMFLSHLHRELYVHRYGTEPPAPYPIAHLDHSNYIYPPPAGEITD